MSLRFAGMFFSPAHLTPLCLPPTRHPCSMYTAPLGPAQNSPPLFPLSPKLTVLSTVTSVYVVYVCILLR